MAQLQTRIEADMKAAMKARAEVELSVLRMLKSDIQYELTKDGSSDLADDKVETLIRRGIKKRKEAIEQYDKAARADLADKEKSELAVLERYLPAAVTEDEIRKVIEEVFAQVKPAGPSDMGKLMGPVMARFKGQNIDGNQVRSLVQARLSGG